MSKTTQAFLSFGTAFALTGASATAASDKISPYAYELTEVFGLPITNSMVMSWIVSAVIIIAFRLSAGKPQLIPSRAQAIVESLIEGIRNLIEPIVGKRLLRPTFPLLIAFFVYILIQNWSGLLPGVGTFGHEIDGHFFYYMRPANADLNGTLALAIIAMIAWFYFVLKYAGVRTLIYDLFGNKASKSEVPTFLYYSLFIVFIMVGFIEVISILFRPVSLSLRLYGNVFGGENLLTNMTSLVSWVVPVPFYFLEVLIGFVQALVFTLLVAVYIGSICNHEEEH